MAPDLRAPRDLTVGTAHAFRHNHFIVFINDAAPHASFLSLALLRNLLFQPLDDLCTRTSLRAESL